MFATDVMSVAFAAIEESEPLFGASVAVFSQGPVGLCVTAAARARGCGLVIAVDTVPSRLEVSKKLGANVVLNAADVDAVEAIMDLTGGRGVDVAVEAVGMQTTFDGATRAVCAGGDGNLSWDLCEQPTARDVDADLFLLAAPHHHDPGTHGGPEGVGAFCLSRIR
jgi:threonine dehydrogenase-like Zn-dependent dehydrogenase